jgi:DNA-binding NarL/FixJ family response regulator
MAGNDSETDGPSSIDEATPPRSPSITARLLLVDDHEIVRRGLRSILAVRRDWEIVGEAANGREAVELARRWKPDVVIMDISMPELNGLDATRQILSISPRTEVLVLTMHESEDLVRDVLKAGARGFLLKTDARENLLAGIEALRLHRPFVSSRVNESVLIPYLGGGALKGESASGRLTPREREIIHLVAQGLTNREIASRLNISVKTAETHRTNVMRKLDVHSVSTLVRYAVRNHIIDA